MNLAVHSEVDMLKFSKALFKFHACVPWNLGPESIFKYMNLALVDNSFKYAHGQQSRFVLTIINVGRDGGSYKGKGLLLTDLESLQIFSNSEFTGDSMHIPLRTKELKIEN